ncbi:ribosomal RNA small subunit methyltransferase A [Tepidimonas charontis]|uniref:Ribosomal RNA small subunit methyltransferase A n=1 Tax=Tepidimonas charontis TaxID=2267262 RepID=A0A554XA84_9BURK|nr:rRNA adenine dimethyltransferase family protein [Tepidimonas charontis]TSE32752.1 Ribosomal RNA small subunit methyltransferase A [Tepidimonas charontis]
MKPHRPPLTDGHRARKRFGQHFLSDPAVIDAIVRAIDPEPGDCVVEIGPGLGALTQPLIDRLGRLTVVELDRDLAARLRRLATLEVVEADVLTVDFGALSERCPGAPRAVDTRPAPQPVHAASPPTPTTPQRPRRVLRVVGNLPYNISTPILFHLLRWADHVRDQHFMLQKEVVQRMVAAPGTAAYGRLSVVLQWRYAMESVLDVPPTAFEPPPRVDSAVVRMQPWTEPAAVDVTRLQALVQVAFSQRRKLLRHTLGPWLAQHDYDGGFDLQRRAEEVSVAEYVALAQAVGTGSEPRG